MRYALTIQAGDSWQSINTLIIEDGLDIEIGDGDECD